MTVIPVQFPVAAQTPITGHHLHWLKVDENNPADKWFVAAFREIKKTGGLVNDKVCEQTKGIPEIKFEFSNESDPEKLKLRTYAACICDKFENLLDKHEILIPSEDRQGDKDEACIYGDEYSELENDVVELLERLVNEVRDKGVSEVDRDSYQ